MTIVRLNLTPEEAITTKPEKRTALQGLKSMTVKDSDFDRFYETCEKVKAPNVELLGALAFVEVKGIR